MGVRVYYYMVAAVLGFGVLLPAAWQTKESIYRAHGCSARFCLRLEIYVLDW